MGYIIQLHMVQSRSCICTPAYFYSQMFQLECLICYLIIQSSAALLPQTTLSKEDQEEIVNVHNEYRRLEGASNMELLVGTRIKMLSGSYCLKYTLKVHLYKIIFNN